MEVRTTKKLELVPFGDLPEGSVFQYNTEYYMKFYKGIQTYNAVNLAGSCAIVVKDDEQVIRARGYYLLEE